MIYELTMVELVDGNENLNTKENNELKTNDHFNFESQ